MKLADLVGRITARLVNGQTVLNLGGSQAVLGGDRVYKQTSTTLALTRAMIGQRLEYIAATTASWTIASDAAAQDTWNVRVYNSGALTLTVLPPAGGTINGGASLILSSGQSAHFFADGSIAITALRGST